MKFNSRRGRPPKIRLEKDQGTKELQLKKIYGLTDEPLDLCLKKDIITEQMHKAGLHLRWLHSIRFGIARVTSGMVFDAGYGARYEDGDWRMAREKDYNAAINILATHLCKEEVLSLCIYNKTPAFLLHFDKLNNPFYRGSYSRLRHGLELLCRAWFSVSSKKNFK